MKKIKLHINGTELTGHQGQTILDIARENNIEIPTLCEDSRAEHYGACGLCVVECEGSPKLLRACATQAAQGMAIQTNTPRVVENRKAALELLLSDHTGDCRPPCSLACPAQTDCQGYAGLIANGEYTEALQLIKEKIPLPASIGRVCPHPCEDACRRKLVEEPVSILALKQYVGDMALTTPPYTIETAPDTRKSVSRKSMGIIGGGPGGLTAAYFLRMKGHAVTVYDAMPKMGGMLRYGIPEYRLPNHILQQEIDMIAQMGIAFKNNTAVGKDITLEELRGAHDAVIVAVGAWVSSGLRCPGENLQGVLGGIDFLREADITGKALAGKNVAVVGGGNTAMDACRTAVRLGAENVYNIYRRTKNEMPAEAIEIEEAEEEGVIFKNLTNPLEIVGEDGRVSAVRLQIMALGAPDASGRRSPVAVEGKEETVPADVVIIAIGQKTDCTGLEALERTRWGTIIADENTCLTNLEGVFAIGDATNNGADIAISAIGEAKKAADMIEKYLAGETLNYHPPYFVTSEKTEEDFTQQEKIARVNMPRRCPTERRNDFREVNLPLSEEDVRREAARCLECGCMDYFECKLIAYANEYQLRPEPMEGEEKSNCKELLNEHPYLRRDPAKCILCGLCVRVCDETVGAGVLGLVGRGFESNVQPALGMNLEEAGCIACGQCAAVCPTGALTENTFAKKQVPLRENVTETVCAFCSAGCKTRLTARGNLLLRSLPAEGALLCKMGRFGLAETAGKPRLTASLLRVNGELKQSSFEDAIASIAARLQGFDGAQIAVTVSGRYTNEDAALIQQFAKEVLKTEKIFSMERTESGLADVLGRDGSTALFDDLDKAGTIVTVLPDALILRGVTGMKIHQAVRKGAQLLQIDDEHQLEDLADQVDQKTVLVFEKNGVSRQIVRTVAQIAAKSGAGILQLLPDPNGQGLSDLGFGAGEELVKAVANGEVRALLAFGEELSKIDLNKLAFLAVHEAYETGAVCCANVVLPARTSTEISGCYTSADGRVQALRTAINSAVCWDIKALTEELAKALGT